MYHERLHYISGNNTSDPVPTKFSRNYPPPKISGKQNVRSHKYWRQAWIVKPYKVFSFYQPSPQEFEVTFVVINFDPHHPHTFLFRGLVWHRPWRNRRAIPFYKQNLSIQNVPLQTFYLDSPEPNSSNLALHFEIEGAIQHVARPKPSSIQILTLTHLGSNHNLVTKLFNPLNASVALIQKPVNWFAKQINWLVSIWGQQWHLMG